MKEPERLARADEIRRRAVAAGQGHLFRFWDELAPPQRADLLADIERIPLDDLLDWVSRHVQATPAAETAAAITPAASIAAIGRVADRRKHAAARNLGIQSIAANRVAALTVAGGQGTRLGFDGPKGLLPVTPVRGKTLYELFAEGILAAQRRFGGAVPWYIMTSDATDDQTRTYFQENGFFGLNPQDVIFFRQGMMPAFGLDGAILLAQKHRVALSPDGHGGVLRALAESGCLADMAGRGIELVSYFQVDNPLVRPVDPILVGLHLQHRADAAAVTIPKADDLERVGNFVRCSDRIRVIEYTELATELAHAKGVGGRRLYDAANLSIYTFSRSFLQRLAAPGSEISLPWHRAEKLVQCIDLSGRTAEPMPVRAVKLERFIFDALHMTPDVILVESRRSECFSPIKNATGVDSLVTAREDMNRRAAHWMKSNGIPVAELESGEPRYPCEISPLAAEEADELAGYVKGRKIDAATGPTYVG